MFRIKAIAAGVAVATVAMPSSAMALSQQAQVKLLNSSTTSTAKPAGKSYVRLSAYLATRDATSVKPQHQTNPVGKVVVTFPSGSYITPGSTGRTVCKQPAGQGAAVMANCANSKIGSGWALVNTGQNLGPDGTPLARPQLSGSPADCAAGTGDPLSWTQYSAVWPSGTLGCVPMGHLWNRVSVYLGGIPEGKTTPSANSVVFVSQNTASIVSFSGSISKNVLTVKLPALYGSGSYPGELFFGWVLSDFQLTISNTKYLKSGSCPSSTRRWKVNTAVTYSQRKETDGLVWDSVLKANRPITAGDIANGVKPEVAAPVPAPVTVGTYTSCR
ncbi:MAG: hypothetical protein WCO96_09035 [Actinomycetes bacterium]